MQFSSKARHNKCSLEEQLRKILDTKVRFGGKVPDTIYVSYDEYCVKIEPTKGAKRFLQRRGNVF